MPSQLEVAALSTGKSLTDSHLTPTRLDQVSRRHEGWVPEAICARLPPAMDAEPAGHGSGWPHTSPSFTAHVCPSRPSPHCACTSPGSVSEIASVSETASSTNMESHREQRGVLLGPRGGFYGIWTGTQHNDWGPENVTLFWGIESLHWNESPSPMPSGLPPCTLWLCVGWVLPT